MKKLRMYFGHPINFYNTETGDNLIMQINFFFPNYILENPNNLFHQINYQRWKEKTGNGMDYYFNKILPRMDSGIFLAFEDRMFGLGVFSEMEKIHELGKPIWEIDFNGKITSIDELDFSRALSLESTIKRVYG